MSPPNNVKIGPLTRAVLNGAVWSENSEFPAFQVWADEIDGVLSFLVVQEVFDRFLPRLRARERDGALAEARAGFFFHRNGFRIIRWEPEEVHNHPGDLDIQWRTSEPIFIEVKGPGWEGELSEVERQAGRLNHPKYINAEGRAIAPAEHLLFAVSKALPKLSESRINLIVVVDDLFVSPIELPKDYLTSVICQGIAGPQFRVVGGVFLLNPVIYSCSNDFVEYRKYFIPNGSALRPLPDIVREGFIAGNNDPQGPRWLRD
jgi:hypothetical protein